MIVLLLARCVSGMNDYNLFRYELQPKTLSRLFNSLRNNQKLPIFQLEKSKSLRKSGWGLSWFWLPPEQWKRVGGLRISLNLLAFGFFSKIIGWDFRSCMHSYTLSQIFCNFYFFLIFDFLEVEVGTHLLQLWQLKGTRRQNEITLTQSCLALAAGLGPVLDFSEDSEGPAACCVLEPGYFARCFWLHSGVVAETTDSVPGAGELKED